MAISRQVVIESGPVLLSPRRLSNSPKAYVNFTGFRGKIADFGHAAQEQSKRSFALPDLQGRPRFAPAHLAQNVVASRDAARGPVFCLDNVGLNGYDIVVAT